MTIYARVKTEEQFDCVRAHDRIDAVIGGPALFERLSELSDRQFYLELPAVLRENRAAAAEAYIRRAEAENGGLLIENLDEIGLLRSFDFKGSVLAGEFLYSYNAAAISFYREFFPEMLFLSPPELTLKELEETEKASGISFIRKIYGHQLLMVTAQCMYQNYGECRKETGSREIPLSFTNQNKDTFLVLPDCIQCCNLIYNGMPVFMMDRLEEMPKDNYLLDLTVEDRLQTEQVIENLDRALQGTVQLPELFTRGHYYKKID